ncbi:hypothetical protein QK313_00170 [Klebsiella michiganensis]|uniref:hypothetical protein n=1 Tax=Klebsiella michiganensis TaxID=1134687 RepID=UPI00249AD7F7|nr:hypothetical protein [Klebsiella michiganensis]MDI3166356.1 hypothetical protein [Klebsiella michiganensis]
MNTEQVNELIQSLESAGELSIKETKVMALAKAFKQLAAENVEAKKIISECREYFIAGVMNRIRPTNEGYLHMICDTFADETPATDRIVAGIKADGVDSGIKTIITMLNHQAPGVIDAINVLSVHSFELREGAK